MFLFVFFKCSIVNIKIIFLFISPLQQFYNCFSSSPINAKEKFWGVPHLLHMCVILIFFIHKSIKRYPKRHEWHLEVDCNQKIRKCQLQLKVGDIHKSLKVWNLIDVHREDHFLQEIDTLNWIEFFQEPSQSSRYYHQLIGYIRSKTQRYLARNCHY